MTRILLALALFSCGGTLRAAEHKVVEGEHMWKLSKQYYGDPYKWRAIAGANPQVADPNRIYPAQVLIIPDIAPAPAPEPAPAPVEAGLAVSSEPAAFVQAAEVKEAEVAPAPAEPEPKAPVEVKAPEPEMPPMAVDESDGLSTKLPESLAGMYPSMSRVTVAKKWAADGRVTGLDEREVMAAQGDLIEAKLAEGVAVMAGDRFYVLRADAPEEGESEKEARYLVRVGVIKAQDDLGKRRWRFVILKSGDSLQVDDLLSRKAL